jgi:hypothetical protein
MGLIPFVIRRYGMQDLMDFEVVTELLGLDARDEKRNRMLLSAVSEEISLFLDRNLLSGTRTDRQQTNLGEFYPEQYQSGSLRRLWMTKPCTPGIDCRKRHSGHFSP